MNNMMKVKMKTIVRV